MKLSKLASLLGCEVEGDGEVEISGVDSIEAAGPGMITYAVDARRAKGLGECGASAAILPPGLPSHGKPTIRTQLPQLAFARALGAFHPPTRPSPGIHPQAVVDPNARIDPSAHIGPYSVVEGSAQIGARTQIGPFSFVGEGVRIGDDCVIRSHVSLQAQARLGNRVILHSGVVIGADGFGYTADEEGITQKIPQVGTVVIEDDVEIGALTAIDRSTLGATRIGKGVKIDNQCQVAHNCDIGDYSIITAQCGLAGGTRLGRGVIMGGASGSTGNNFIGDGARLASLAGVVGDVPAGEAVAGQPAIPLAAHKRAIIGLRRLPELLKRVRELERAVNPRGKDGKKK
jgi:UDP-3-O-[3-hydroxymyristoyl] glucosamine N-acyltransferase